MNRNGTIIYRGPSELDASPIVGLATCLVDVTDNVKMSKRVRERYEGMVQVFVLPDPLAYPGQTLTEIVNRGRDASVCGDCPLKPSMGGIELRTERELLDEIWCPADDSGGGRVGCQECGLCAGSSRPAKSIVIPLHGAVRNQCYVQVSKSVQSTFEAVRRGSYAVGQWSRLQGRDIRAGAWGDPAALPVWVTLRLWIISGRVFTGYTHQWRRPAVQPLRHCLMASVETAAARDAARAAGWRTFRATA